MGKRRGRPPNKFSPCSTPTRDVAPSKSKSKSKSTSGNAARKRSKKGAAGGGGGGGGKKKRRKASSSSSDGDALPSARTWIYAATTTEGGSDDDDDDDDDDDEDRYARYLHRRVRRFGVRSIPGNYSYFRPPLSGDGDGDGDVAAAAAGAGGGATASSKSERKIQRSLDFEHVPLPPEDEAADDGGNNNNNNGAAYSKFCAPVAVKDSRLAKFRFSLNYSTHVPDKNLITYVGFADGGTSGDANDAEEESGYVLRMPLVEGTVVGYSPPLSSAQDYDDDDDDDEPIAEDVEFPTWRQRDDQPLFRILWDGRSALDVNNGDGGETAGAAGYVEDVTLPELLLAVGESSESSGRERLRASQEAALSVRRHVHATTTRRQLSLEWKVECEILPRLATCAALELRREAATRVRLEMLLERKRLRAASGLREEETKRGGNEGSGRRGEAAINADGTAFGYYSRHPNQYMSSFVPPPPLPSDDEDSDGEDDAAGGGGGGGSEGAGGGRSKTRLTRDELSRYSEKVDELCRLAPSKIAERVRAACALAYEYARSRGSLDEYASECAARDEREREERDLSARAAADGGGEVRRSARARTSVNYNHDGTALGERLPDDDGLEEGGGGAGCELPRENACGGPTARLLLDLLGMLPEEDEVEDDEDGDDEESTEEEEEEEDDEEEEDSDPFFEPDPCLILDQLGRKQRYMSPADIQSAIVRAIEGEPLETPNCLLDEEEAEDSEKQYVTDLAVTTDDKVEDLPQFEPASFARCRFAPRTRPAESDDDDHPDAADAADEDDPERAERERLAREASLRRRAERRAARRARERERNAELERAYRAGKAYELWRFRSVHGDGCAVWPSWGERSRELLRRSDGAAAMSTETATADGGVGGADPATRDGTAPRASPPPDSSSAAARNDEELARSLAAAEASESAVAADGDPMPLATRRRGARRGGAAGFSSEPVFYGGYQSMSRDQLLDTLVRLLKQASASGGSSSLMDLKRLVFPESYESSRGGQAEMKKLRSALGQLVYKLGRVGRLLVDVEGGDKVCWEVLREQGPLVKFDLDGEDDLGSSGNGAAIVRLKENAAAVKSEEGSPAAKPAEDAKERTPSDAISSAVVVSSSSSPAPTTRRKSQLLALEEYIAGLHRTELLLRRALMKAVDKNQGGGNPGAETLLQISTCAIATAADETEGDADAEDWKFFLPRSGQNDSDGDDDDRGGDLADVQWSNDAGDHVLLGRAIYRPLSSPLRLRQGDAGDRPNEKCHWYRIVSYTPSVKAVVAAAGGEVDVNGRTTSTAYQGNPPDGGGEKDGNDNAVVERRMRFRAVPTAESDVNAPLSEVLEEMDVDDEDVEYMVLTEAQARAGAEAAVLHRRIESERRQPRVRGGVTASRSRGARAQHHPYRNGHGSRVMLTPLREEGDGANGHSPRMEVLYGVIVGHTTTTVDSTAADDEIAKHKLLVLLEMDDHDGNENGKGDDEGCCDSEGKAKSSPAFWATVDDEGTLLTDIVLDNRSSSEEADAEKLCARYSIDMHEFYQGSPAYNVCESIVSYLKKHSKSGPFLQPVDPIALGIPDYPKIVKYPMDISALAKNLADGKYARVPPAAKYDDAENAEEDGTETPVYRMAYGPFFEDLMLIFDNCIRFNGETSWIGNEAGVLKKNATKKLEQTVSRAVWSGRGGIASGAKKLSAGAAGALSSSRRAGKRSVYAEEDSDVDMYEYESEYEDDDDGGGGKRRPRKSKGNGRSKNGSKKKASKEDIPSRAIEQPLVLPENAHEFGTGGAFPHLKIQTNVGKFSLSQDWSARHIKEIPCNDSGGNEVGEAGKEKPPAEDEMLMLLQMQQEEEDASSIRRSSRARHAPKNYADEEVEENPTTSARSYTTQAPITLPGVEYYLVDDDFLQPKKKTLTESDGGEEEVTIKNDHRQDCDDDADTGHIPTVCRSRLGAEGVQETIHEDFYAKLYREHSKDALILDSGIGKYTNGSFPPYLGRVVPAIALAGGGAEEDEDAAIWEIREQYLVPALRWVLRGLVRSGHLQEVDSSLSEGAADDAPARTSFGAGIVVPSHEYYYNEGGPASFPPFDVLDEKEILRRRRQDAAGADGGNSSSEEEVELSEYEQMRAARVARNAERLKALGLA